MSFVIKHEIHFYKNYKEEQVSINAMNDSNADSNLNNFLEHQEKIT